MLKELRMENWKSFQQSSLHIDPLVVLIGSNASGKSNALEALHFLGRSATGVPLASLVPGHAPGLTPGAGGAWHSGQTHCALEAVVAAEKEDTDFVYRVELSAQGAPRILAESLTRILYRKTGKIASETLLLDTDACEDDDPACVTARLYNRGKGKPRVSDRQQTILSQLHPEVRAGLLPPDICEAVLRVHQALSAIFVLDPAPSCMRGYSRLCDTLERNAANMAGVIAALDDSRKKAVEESLTFYAAQLPTRNISQICAGTAGRLDADAMLYCNESWGEKALTIDVRGLSDGTLRFLAILTALLVRPEQSLLLVENIDAGLHPSHTRLLLDAIKAIGSQRAITVVVTSHSPALLDGLGPEMTPFVTISYRHQETGATALQRLEELSGQDEGCDPQARLTLWPASAYWKLR